MKIEINGESLQMNEATTVVSLVSHLQLPERGVALAINQKMVPQAQWNETQLNDGDKVLIIKAACGG